MQFLGKQWQVFAMLLVALTAHGQGTESATEVAGRVDARYNHLQSVQGEFTQIYRGGGPEIAESGTMWLKKAGFKKPGKMRWEYRSPIEKLFVSDGQTAWFYLPQERQARKASAKTLDDMRSPLGYLLGKTRLEKELQALSLAPDVPPLSAGDVVLRGVPTGLGDRFSDILLEITAESWIARIVVRENDGSTTEYRFRDWKENVVVKDELFRFVPPAGTEVVEGELGQ